MSHGSVLAPAPEPASVSAISCLAVLIPFCMIFLLLSGCCLLGPEISVDVEIPGHRWEDAGLQLAYTLVYPDVDGLLRSDFLPPGVHRTVIQVPRRTGTPVVAYPMGRLKPFGGFLMPVVRREGPFGNISLKLEASRGAFAEMMIGMWHYRDRCATVYLDVLQDALEARGDGNPWACDLERIKHAILTGTLNYLQIRKLTSFTAELYLPSGEWISECDCSTGGVTAVQATADGRFLLRMEELCPGCSRFYSPETGLELHIYMDKKGDCRFVYGSPPDFSRRY